jgi:hypothetical protein
MEHDVRHLIDLQHMFKAYTYSHRLKRVHALRGEYGVVAHDDRLFENVRSVAGRYRDDSSAAFGASMPYKRAHAQHVRMHYSPRAAHRVLRDRVVLTVRGDVHGSHDLDPAQRQAMRGVVVDAVRVVFAAIARDMAANVDCDAWMSTCTCTARVDELL